MRCGESGLMVGNEGRFSFLFFYSCVGGMGLGRGCLGFKRLHMCEPVVP